MNIYEAKTANLLHKIDLDQEYYAIASNNIDKIALGGDNKQVNIHTLVKPTTISDDEIFGENMLSEPYLAMHF